MNSFDPMHESRLDDDSNVIDSSVALRDSREFFVEQHHLMLLKLGKVGSSGRWLPSPKRLPS